MSNEYSSICVCYYVYVRDRFYFTLKCTKDIQNLKNSFVLVIRLFDTLTHSFTHMIIYNNNFFFVRLFVVYLATDTAYEVAVTALKLSSAPTEQQQHEHQNSLTKCVDGRSSNINNINNTDSNNSSAASKIVHSNQLSTSSINNHQQQQQQSVTTIVKNSSDNFSFNDYSKIIINPADDINCNEPITLISVTTNSCESDDNNTAHRILSAATTDKHSEDNLTKFIVNNCETITISHCNNKINHNHKNDNKDHCVDMVQQHQHAVQQQHQRKTPAYDNNANIQSVIIENVNSRVLLGDPIITPTNVGNTQTIYTLESPTSSPLRYSTLQTIVENNNHHYLTNNNNNNNCTNWNYDLSLDLRHKPADVDKVHPHHQQQQQHNNVDHHHQHIHIISDNTSANHNNHNHQHHTTDNNNEIIEQQRTIIASTNNNNSNHFSDIQPVIIADHYQNSSAETAVMRSGLISMYSPTFATSSTNQSHHSNNGRTGGGSNGNGTNSTIDEVIADTLKDENCTMVEGNTSANSNNSSGNSNNNNNNSNTNSGNNSNHNNGVNHSRNASNDDETAHYLSLTSTSDLQHLKDNIYTTNSGSNNNSGSGSAHHNHSTASAQASGDSRSPTNSGPLSQDDYDGGLQSFTNLTSAHSNNNRETLYSTSTIPETVHPNSIHAMNTYESALHSAGIAARYVFDLLCFIQIFETKLRVE